MRGWVRILLIMSGIAVIAFSGAMFPVLVADHWPWGLALILFAIIGVDLIAAGILERSPWLLESLWDVMFLP